MPHTLDWRDGGLFRTFTGIVTGTEIIESNLKMHGDHRFDEIKYVVNDFSKVEECILSENDLVELQTIDHIAEYSKVFLKIAIIVTNDALIDLAKFYCQIMRENAYETEIFANLEEAHKWAKTREIVGM